MCDCRFFSKLKTEPKETFRQTAIGIRDAIILTLAVILMEYCYNNYLRNVSYNRDDANQNTNQQNNFITKDDLIRNYYYQKSFCSSDKLFYALVDAPFKEEFQFRFLYLKFYIYVLTNFSRFFISMIARMIKKAFSLDDADHAEMKNKLIEIATKISEALAIAGQAVLFAEGHTRASQASVFVGGLMAGYLALYNEAGFLASLVSHSTHNAIALAGTCSLPKIG